MEIKISPQGMLTVLRKAGLDETDAKAIIYDLLTYGVPDDKEIETSQPARRVLEKTIQQRRVSRLASEADDGVDAEEEDPIEEPAEPAPEVSRTKISRSRRLSFNNFGGPAEPVK